VTFVRVEWLSTSPIARALRIDPGALPPQFRLQLRLTHLAARFVARRDRQGCGTSRWRRTPRGVAASRAPRMYLNSASCCCVNCMLTSMRRLGQSLAVAHQRQKGGPTSTASVAARVPRRSKIGVKQTRAADVGGDCFCQLR